MTPPLKCWNGRVTLFLLKVYFPFLLKTYTVLFLLVKERVRFWAFYDQLKLTQSLGANNESKIPFHGRVGLFEVDDSSLTDPTGFYFLKLWALWVRRRGRGRTWAHYTRVGIRGEGRDCVLDPNQRKEWLLLQHENMSTVGEWLSCLWSWPQGRG